MSESFESPTEDVAEQQAVVGDEDQTEHAGEHFEADPADAWEQEEVVSVDDDDQ